jgi:hypothetical protein
MQYRWPSWMVILALTLPVCLVAQDTDAPLGDVARALRREKEDKKTPDHNIIDNENLDQLMNELQSKKFNSTSLLFSLDGQGKNFKVSAPDVSCSLSFNGKATSLLTDTTTPRTIPNEEIAKLDGPAIIQGNTLQISVYNGSEWNVKELIVGLTTLRLALPKPYGPVMLQPASQSVVELEEKRPDQTVIVHLKGSAAPRSTTVFTTDLTSQPGQDQDWHWAIVGAKGLPADPPATANPATVPAVLTAEPTPATSSGSLHP